jgi:ariadne-1
VLDELTVIKYLEDEDLKNRFRATLVQSFVDDNQLVRWCPGAHCTNALVLHEVLESKNEAMTCKLFLFLCSFLLFFSFFLGTCGVTFCFRCGVETDHRPNSCRMFGEWAKKQAGGDTSLNDQLIATISRMCPKCNTSIQKNGGCNHMKCTLCAYHFCWLCMGKFGSGPKGGPDGYNTHRCNRAYEDEGEVSVKKEELARFHWHSDRYGNHARSLTLEQKLLANAPDIMTALSSQFGLSQQATKFYGTALRQLVDNRHLLMQSYVFGYFRPMYAKNVNRDIFENLQLDLELHTEKLSHILEDTSCSAIQGTNHQAILHLTQVARNVYHGLMDSANEWTSTGAVSSPPNSPPVPIRSAKSSSDIGARIGAATGKSRKGSTFFKKLFKRGSEDSHGKSSGNNNNNNNNDGGNDDNDDEEFLI